MRLSRWTISFVVLALTLGCRDTTGPERVAAQFVLLRVNGEPLPGVVWSDATGSFTVLSSTLSLDKEGHAVVSESYRLVSNGSTSQSSFTANLSYKLIDEQIEIGSFTPCGPAAVCIGNDKGTLINGVLTLRGGLIAQNSDFLFASGPTVLQ